MIFKNTQATNKKVTHEFLTFGGESKKLTEYFFSPNNPKSELNKTRCIAAYDAILNYVKTGIVHPAVKFYNTALKTPKEELVVLCKQHEKKKPRRHRTEYYARNKNSKKP